MLRLQWKHGWLDLPESETDFETVNNAFTPGELPTASSFTINFPPTVNNDRAYSYARHLESTRDARELSVEIYFENRYSLGKVVLSEAGTQGYTGVITLDTLSVDLFEKTLDEYAMLQNWSECFELITPSATVGEQHGFLSGLMPKENPYYCFPATIVKDAFENVESINREWQGFNNRFWYNDVLNLFISGRGYQVNYTNQLLSAARRHEQFERWLMIPHFKPKGILTKILGDLGWKISGSFGHSKGFDVLEAYCNKLLLNKQKYLNKFTNRESFFITNQVSDRYFKWDTASFLDIDNGLQAESTDPFWVTNKGKFVRISTPAVYRMEVKMKITPSDAATWDVGIIAFQEDQTPNIPYVFSVSFQSINLNDEGSPEIVSLIYTINLTGITTPQWIAVRLAPDSIPAGFSANVEWLTLAVSRCDIVQAPGVFRPTDGTLDLEFEDVNDKGYLPNIKVTDLIKWIKDIFNLSVETDPINRELILDYATDQLMREPVKRQIGFETYIKRLTRDVRGYDLYFDFQESDDKQVEGNFAAHPDIATITRIGQKLTNVSPDYLVSNVGAIVFNPNDELFDARLNKYRRYIEEIFSTRLFENITDAHYHRKKGEQKDQKEYKLPGSPMLMNEQFVFAGPDVVRIIAPSIQAPIRFRSNDVSNLKNLKLSYYWGLQNSIKANVNGSGYLMGSPMSLNTFGLDVDPAGTVDWLVLNPDLATLETVNGLTILSLQRSLYRRHKPWLHMLMTGNRIRSTIRFNQKHLVKDIKRKPIVANAQRFLIVSIQFKVGRSGELVGECELLQLKTPIE